MKIKYFLLIFCTSSLLFAMENNQPLTKKRKINSELEAPEPKRKKITAEDIYMLTEDNYENIKLLFKKIDEERTKRIHSSSNLHNKIKTQKKDQNYFFPLVTRLSRQVTDLSNKVTEQKKEISILKNKIKNPYQEKKENVPDFFYEQSNYNTPFYNNPYLNLPYSPINQTFSPDYPSPQPQSRVQDPRNCRFK